MGFKSQIRMCLQWIFSKEAIHEVVYLGRPADRGKIALTNTKVYLAVLRKSLLFFISKPFKVPCTIRIMATSPCGLFTTPSSQYFEGERSGPHGGHRIQK